MMDPTKHFVLVPLFLSCAFAAPQFAYSTTTFGHPFVPLPVARVAYNEDLSGNHIDQSPQEVQPARLPPSPYHFIPATLPQAIYSEPAHILSGYSYQTVDPAGAKSQVLFVSGPNSQQLFRQNADLLQIVLPSLFTADGDNVIPRSAADSDGAVILEETDPANGPGDGDTDGSAGTSAESKTEESPFENASEEDIKPTLISEVPDKSDGDSSKEQSDKSSEEEGSTSSPAEKEDDLKIDVSTSEASNSPKAVPPESDSVESASTESPTTSANNASDNQKSEEKMSDESKSDEKTSEVESSDQTTEPTVTSTTTVPSE